MFEGKNIHFSPIDQKLLCSYSEKLCKQHRLNGYGFCVRHILEDKSAPFKQCAYVAKYNHQNCKQAIPQTEKRKYCNAHMQVLGMLPKRKRKNKQEQEAEMLDNKSSFEERLKSRFNRRTKRHENVNDNSLDDPDDPYAFTDSEPVQPNFSPASAGTQPDQSSFNHFQPAGFRQNPDPTSTIAKLYPELAEKLERVKNKTEPKQKGLGNGVKSSRTMNRLQNKIAQNRIKAKKNQEISSQSTPEQQPSPQPAAHSINGEKPQFAVHNPLSYGSNLHPAAWGMGMHAPSPIKPASPFSVPHIPNIHHQTLQPGLPRHIAPVVHQSPSLQGPIHTPPQASNTPLSKISTPRFQTPPNFSFSHTRNQIIQSRPRVQQKEVPGDIRKKLRSESALHVYQHHLVKREYNSDLLPFGVDSSDDEDLEDVFPRQHHWLVLSSDDSDLDEEDSESDEDAISTNRLVKIAEFSSDVRRQLRQVHKSQHSSQDTLFYRKSFARALVQAARESPAAAVKAVLETEGRHAQERIKRAKRSKQKSRKTRPCLYKNEDKNETCDNTALPYTNHCVKHIMYNIDQQLFDYCTAKFPDNTQCCYPVFDIFHEMPLCLLHGKQAETVIKQSPGDELLPKKARKKTKPSALTRPPKKGKKKKNLRRNVRPQKPSPPTEPSGNSELPSHIMPLPGALLNGPIPLDAADVDQELPTDIGADMEEDLSPSAIDKSFELPLDQASRLLDDNDFHEVLNKLQEVPDDLDLFTGKNGEFETTKEEAEELERALAVATASGDAKDTLDSLAKSIPHMSEDELTDRITDTILEAESSRNDLANSALPELSSENLNQLASLANSISANDLKNMTLGTTVLNSALNDAVTYTQGHTQLQSHVYPGIPHLVNQHGNYMAASANVTNPTALLQRQFSTGNHVYGGDVGQQITPTTLHSSPRHYGNTPVNMSPRQHHQNSPLSQSPMHPPPSPMHVPSPLPGHSPIPAQSPMQSPLPNSHPRPWFPQQTTNEHHLIPQNYHNGYPVPPPQYSHNMPLPNASATVKYTYAPQHQFVGGEFNKEMFQSPGSYVASNPQLAQRLLYENQPGLPSYQHQHVVYSGTNNTPRSNT